MAEDNASRQGRVSRYKTQIEYQRQLIQQLQDQLDAERKQFNAFVSQLRFGVTSTTEVTSDSGMQRSGSPHLQSLRCQYSLKKQLAEKQREIDSLNQRLQTMQLSHSDVSELSHQLKLSQFEIEAQQQENRELAQKLAEVGVQNAELLASSTKMQTSQQNSGSTALEAELKQSQARALLLEHAGEEKTKEIASLREVNLQLAGELSQCRREIEELTRTMDSDMRGQQQLSQQWQNEIDVKEGQIKCLNSEKAACLECLQGMQQQVVELKQHISDKDVQMRALEDRLGLLSEQQTRKSKENAETQDQIQNFFHSKQEAIAERDKIIEILHSQVQNAQLTNAQLQIDLQKAQTELLSARQAKQELNDSTQFVAPPTGIPALPRPDARTSGVQRPQQPSVAKASPSTKSSMPRSHQSAEDRKSSIREDIKSIDKQISDLLEEKVLPQESSGNEQDHSERISLFATEAQPTDTLETECHGQQDGEQNGPASSEHCAENFQSAPQAATECDSGVVAQKEAPEQPQSAERQADNNPDLEARAADSRDAPLSPQNLSQADVGRNGKLPSEWRRWDRSSLPSKQDMPERQRKGSYATASRGKHDSSALDMGQKEALDQSGIAKREVEIVKDDADSVE